jgi:transcriptional regulator with XRE-family HTH domain
MANNKSAARAKAVDLLALGLSQSDAAAKLSLNPRTISRWMRDDKFATLVDYARAHHIADVRNLLVMLGRPAVATLGKAIKGDKVGIASIRAAELTLRALGVLEPQPPTSTAAQNAALGRLSPAQYQE